MSIRFQILRWGFVGFVLIASAASASSTLPEAGQWQASPQLASQQKNPENLLSYCIQKNEGTWQVAESCDLNKANYEMVAVDPYNLTFHLSAPTPRRSGSSWECPRNSAGASGRSNHGYTLCNSAFTKGSSNIDEAVFGGINSLLFGSSLKALPVDTEALSAAAISAGLHQAAYNAAFSKAKSSQQLSKLIATYQNNDPDQLIPEAEARLKEYETNEKVAIEAERLRRKNDAAANAEAIRNKELERVAATAKKEKQRKIWLSRIQPGDDCWIGPFSSSYMSNFMLKAMVIETKPALVRVQYDGGQTNKPNFNVNRDVSEEWVKRENVYPSDWN